MPRDDHPLMDLPLPWGDPERLPRDACRFPTNTQLFVDLPSYPKGGTTC